jgi:hypothetical protein
VTSQIWAPKIGRVRRDLRNVTFWRIVFRSDEAFHVDVTSVAPGDGTTPCASEPGR